MHILFAEDDSTIRRIASRVLQCQGYTLEIKSDGAELLESLKSGCTFDVVVTDNQMPCIRGVDALRWMRENERFKNMPVIVHSGDEDMIVKKLVENLGGIFVQKTSDYNDLIVVLKALEQNIGTALPG